MRRGGKGDCILSRAFQDAPPFKAERVTAFLGLTTQEFLRRVADIKT